jgi:hypothetical protein
MERPNHFIKGTPMRSLLVAFAFAAGCTTPVTNTSCVPACASGFRCDNGSCVVDALDMAAGTGDGGSKGCAPACGGGTPYCNDQNHCVACLTDDNCPMGSYCKTLSESISSCVVGCVNDAHCGGKKCCSGGCVDTTSNPGNCGACGTNCMAPHAQASCTNSACTAGSCTPGYGDCNGDPKDGCEANLHVDAANCTGCGMACALPNAIPACSDGCYISACNFGYDDCNQDPSDGCETSTLSDIANCGGCGVPCNGLPNAKATCTAGNCVLGVCNVGFFDCNNNPQDGCEVAVGTDVNNCGTCGNKCGNGLVCINGGCTCAKCNFPNAASSCVNNVCVMGACVQGFGDCNKNPNDGCEVNFNTDANNCTGCGIVCPMNAPFCSNGVCGQGADYGPMHTFVNLTTDHYITQGGCSVGSMDADAIYFCKHFYGDRLGQNCTPKQGYHLMQTPMPTYPKMHKNGGCTSNGSDIPMTTCDINGNDSACKIGNWNESTNGLVGLICHCQ